MNPPTVPFYNKNSSFKDNLYVKCNSCVFFNITMIRCRYSNNNPINYHIKLDEIILPHFQVRSILVPDISPCFVGLLRTWTLQWMCGLCTQLLEGHYWPLLLLLLRETNYKPFLFFLIYLPCRPSESVVHGTLMKKVRFIVPWYPLLLY